MNYYIDFDSTLYNTQELTNSMLNTLANSIIKQDSTLIFEDIIAEEKDLFKSTKIYNIFELCRFFAEKYNINAELLISNINGVINNGMQFVYPDTIPFLKGLIKNGHTLNMLTYTKQNGIEYQLQKVNGSGVAKYFNNIFVVSTPKWQLDLDYTKGIFIDDNPSDLAGLYENNPTDIIRIRRANNKYSKIEMPDNLKIKEYEDFSQIQ